MLHVNGGGKTALLANHESKVMIGDEAQTIGSTLEVRSKEGNGNIARFINNRLSPEEEDPHAVFIVSGSSDGGGFFGSNHSGSNLMVSGSSNLASVTVNYSSSNTHPLLVNMGARAYVFGMDSSVGAYSVFLQSAFAAGVGRKIIVKDTGNNAGSNNITVTGSTRGDLIEYSTSTSVAGNKRGITLVSDGVNRWWVVSAHAG